MSDQLIILSSAVQYEAKEAAVILAATAFVIAVGGVGVAAVIVCGWGGAKQVVMDFLRGKATFICR